MAVNILEQFKDEVLDTLSSVASGFIGESETTTKGVLESVAPAILSAVVQRSKTEEGASGLLNMLNQDSSNILSDLGSLFGGGDSMLNKIMDSGLPIVRSLMGDKLGSIIDWISNKNSTSSHTVSSLLSLATPFIMSLISRRVKGDNLGFSGLTSLLGDQSASIASMIPAGLSGLLDFSGVGTAAKEAVTKVSNRISDDSEETESKAGVAEGKPNYLPWILLIAGLILMWFLLRNCNSCKKTETVTTTTEAMDTMQHKMNEVADTIQSKVIQAAAPVKGALNAAGDWVADLGNTINLELPGGIQLNVGENSVEKRLVDFINTKTTDTAVLKHTWFTFDRLYFEKGKSTLTKESEQQVKNIYAIMKAYPSLYLKFGGYTDSDGDAAMNQKLSDTRADAARLAVKKLGITGIRIQAEGYGEQYPVCPANDTPECKAKNRRIEIRVARM
jgi:outer membrane protein OmpA-like peptidoglycan-associated protein